MERDDGLCKLGSRLNGSRRRMSEEGEELWWMWDMRLGRRRLWRLYRLKVTRESRLENFKGRFIYSSVFGILGKTIWMNMCVETEDVTS